MSLKGINPSYIENILKINWVNPTI